MSLFLWRPSYEIGIGEIDMQHRHLVGIINELFDAMKEGHGQDALNHVLEGLVEYIDVHFRTEEELMRAAEYPEFDYHKIEHEFLTRQVQLLQKRREQGERIATPELMNFLRGWLENHITVSDKAFGRYHKGLKAAGGA